MDDKITFLMDTGLAWTFSEGFQRRKNLLFNIIKKFDGNKIRIEIKREFYQ